MPLKKKLFLEVAFILLISAIIYLPNAGSFAYFKDEWYFMYDAYIGGARIFPFMFNIDRPARGVFFEIYYLLFGPYALPYHVVGYAWRVLSMIGALWLFNILWPQHRKFAFLGTLLFGLYPGYTWWVSAIEYQTHIASLALQVFSIVFSLKAVQASNRMSITGHALGAIVTGWAYIALVDYAIGMEAFRLFCIHVLVNRNSQHAFLQKAGNTIRIWAWNLFIPFGFVFWRIFFFDNGRRATDIGLQISGLFSSPITTLISWFLLFFNGILNLAVLAWFNQLSNFFFGMRLRDMAVGLLIAVSTLALLFLCEVLLHRAGQPPEAERVDQTAREALFIGAAGMAIGIAPVIMANRSINLDVYSHYALPASLAVAAFVTGFLYMLSSSRVRLVCLYSIIGFAALAHHGISVSALNEENAIRKFWWQVHWRVPALKPGTTLVIHYPSGNIGDDGNGVVQAANMIYFPEPSLQLPVRYQVSALTLAHADVQELMLGKLQREIVYRSHAASLDYGNILVLSQPTSSSCVHVIDGRRPVISAFDPGDVALISTSSNIENVIAEADPLIPQPFAFGTEPEHKWCYFFEKAELALQLGNWEDAAALGEEAIRLGLHPEDQSEWLPFLQAYALAGNEKRVQQTAPKINTERFLRLQACDLLGNLEGPLTPGVQDLISTLYCRNAE
jgi:hypothetical protein